MVRLTSPQATDTKAKDEDLLAPSRQVTGKACHPERNARDLRKISPFGRNDNSHYLCALCAFAGDIPILFGCGVARQI
jgi:hypothetical protein